jgi:hypothetical protein
MLTLTYTEFGLHLDLVTAPLEALITQRVVVSMQAGQALLIEPGHASFLLPKRVPGLQYLEAALRHDGNYQVTIAPVDRDYVEVSVSGSWLAAAVDAEDGTFVTALGDRTEFLVHQLWQSSQSLAPSLA